MSNTKLTNESKEYIQDSVLGNLNKFENILIVPMNDELLIMSLFKLKHIQPTTKEIRLALDLLRFFYPLYTKANIETKAEFIKDIFNYDCNIQRIINVKPFKKILFKKVISKVNKKSNGKYKVKTIKVRRT